jgi:hypothetical protein
MEPESLSPFDGLPPILIQVYPIYTPNPASRKCIVIFFPIKSSVWYSHQPNKHFASISYFPMRKFWTYESVTDDVPVTEV